MVPDTPTTDCGAASGQAAAVDLSVVVPVYGSAGILPALVERLTRVLDAWGGSYEILFVDDGSPDGAWEVLESLQTAHPDRLVAIQLMRNFGQHNALMCGFRHARGALVATLDDDLQTPPEELPKLLREIEQTGLDVVYGSYAVKHHSLLRNMGSAVVRWFYRLVFKSQVAVTSFRVIRREVVASIDSYSLNFTYVDGLLAWNTQRIGQVAVEHHPRADGRSGYSLGKLLTLAANVFTNFSILPLQAASAVGFLIAGCGTLLGLYYLVYHLVSGFSVPGYASTIIAILVLGGVQLVSLGIIGEYVGRLHLNMNRKPQYTIRSLRGTTGAVPTVRIVETAARAAGSADEGAAAVDKLGAREP